MEIYAVRRRALMQQMQGGVALLKSAPVYAPNRGDVVYAYRQQSDFYYLTGYEEEEAICLLAPEHPEHKFILFVLPREKSQEVWYGKRIGVDDAMTLYGADIAYPLDQLDTILPRYLKGVSMLYYSSGKAEAFDEEIITLLRTYAQKYHIWPTHLIDPGPILNTLRVIKGSEELALLRRAAEITCEGYLEAIKRTRPGMYEYETQAVLEYVYRRQGSPRNGYSPLVASAGNATTLHYIENRRRIEDGDLVLIDSGAEYGYYTADVSRSFPANGRFSPPQRALYEVVLKAELAAIALVRPGITLMDIHRVAVETIVAGLVELGILQGEVSQLITDGAYYPFFMHLTCHWLGLDLHDRGRYKVVDGEDPLLQPGMVFTIEPGLYIIAGMENVDPQYWNIGIRIEDDVVVTETGCEVLTASIPRTVAEIEALMAEAHQS